VNDSPEPPRPPGSGGPKLRFAPGERQAVAGLAAIYGSRMLGLFLLLPVLALYAGALSGGTPLLAGVAVGAYGLTQAFLQIPFGLASDRLGRRPVIAFGLLLYAAGSLLGTVATGIWGVIVARMVQGAGAVSGPVTALLADLTRAELRTRAMAIIGITIGGSFVVSLVAAPLLQAAIGVPGIFAAMAALALVGLALLYAVVPHPGGPARGAGAARLGEALRLDLARYYAGIFALTAVLTATFVGVPHALHDELGLAVHDHWRTYLWVFGASVPPTVALVLYSERARVGDGVMRLCIALLMIALGAIAFVHASYWPLCGALTAFFTAFNYLEARLPARLSQAAGPEVRGAALSIFATAQFLGSFAGGSVAGWLLGGPLGLVGVFGVASLVSLGWLLAQRPAAA
jgi:MFS family permease